MREFTPDEKIVVGLAAAPDGSTVVILGISEASFAAIADGRTHTADLRKVGLGVQVIVMRGKDRMNIAAQLGDVNAVLGKEPHDLGIDTPPGEPELMDAVSKLRAVCNTEIAFINGQHRTPRVIEFARVNAVLRACDVVFAAADRKPSK